MTYTEPPLADLPRLCAEAMGWKIEDSNFSLIYESQDGKQYYNQRALCCEDGDIFQPESCHDHAQLLIQDAIAKGFDLRLAEILCEPHHGREYYKVFLTADPETKTRAYLRAYHESKP